MGEHGVKVEFAGSREPPKRVGDEELPRPLSAREAETLRFMLSAKDPRLDPLRGQADAALVKGRCDCGCATIDLAVDRDLARPASGLCFQVLETRTPEFNPDKGPFELILYLDDGWLKELEVVFYANDPPSEFPSIDEFEPPRLLC
jgi:hypothetical protein